MELLTSTLIYRLTVLSLFCMLSLFIFVISGPRNVHQFQPTLHQQQHTLTPAKSMPSLNQPTTRQNVRSVYNRGGEANAYRPPRFRHNSHKTASRPQQTPDRLAVPPPPPPFPPPSPSQPTASSEWASSTTSKENHGRWIRGMVIKGKLVYESDT